MSRITTFVAAAVLALVVQGAANGAKAPVLHNYVGAPGSLQAEKPTVADLNNVRSQVTTWLIRSGFTDYSVSEVMAFTNNDYIAVANPKGKPAFELLAAPGAGWLMLEPPSMMWNTRYGMMAGSSFGTNWSGSGMMPSMMGGTRAAGQWNGWYATGHTKVTSVAQAVRIANRWLAKAHPGEKAESDARHFPGYFTTDTVFRGKIAGMLSVNASDRRGLVPRLARRLPRRARLRAVGRGACQSRLVVSGTTTQASKAAAFRALHEGEPFVLPNPWDAGSARVLAALGFEALATTSSGLAFTLGRLDGSVTLDEVADHTAVLDRATDLPVAVDLENGYGPDPDSAAGAIYRVAAAGAVGGSIEDWDPAGFLYESGHAVERVAAAAQAAHALGFPFMLAARAENHIRGNPDIHDTIARLQAFERAGADVLYAPGLRSVEEIRAVCRAVGRPVNVLSLPGLTVSEIFAAGAQRVSVGGALTWVAAQAMVDAAVALRDTGDLSALAARLPLGEWLGR